MKAIKVSFQTELIDVSSPVMYFATASPPTIHYNGGQPDLATFEQERWVLKQVYTGEKVEQYLVKDDTEAMFKDLLAINTKSFNQLVAGKLSKESERIESIATEEERKRIKELPWWKRLLNRLDGDKTVVR